MLLAFFPHSVEPDFISAPCFSYSNSAVRLRGIFRLEFLPEICMTLHRESVPTLGLYLFYDFAWQIFPFLDLFQRNIELF